MLDSCSDWDVDSGGCEVLSLSAMSVDREIGTPSKSFFFSLFPVTTRLPHFWPVWPELRSSAVELGVAIFARLARLFHGTEGDVRGLLKSV